MDIDLEEARLIIENHRQEQSYIVASLKEQREFRDLEWLSCDDLGSQNVDQTISCARSPKYKIDDPNA